MSLFVLSSANPSIKYLPATDKQMYDTVITTDTVGHFQKLLVNNGFNHTDSIGNSRYYPNYDTVYLYYYVLPDSNVVPSGIFSPYAIFNSEIWSGSTNLNWPMVLNSTTPAMNKVLWANFESEGYKVHGAFTRVNDTIFSSKFLSAVVKYNSKYDKGSVIIYYYMCRAKFIINTPRKKNVVISKTKTIYQDTALVHGLFLSWAKNVVLYQADRLLTAVVVDLPQTVQVAHQVSTRNSLSSSISEYFSISGRKSATPFRTGVFIQRVGNKMILKQNLQH